MCSAFRLGARRRVQEPGLLATREGQRGRLGFDADRSAAGGGQEDGQGEVEGAHGPGVVARVGAGAYAPLAMAEPGPPIPVATERPLARAVLAACELFDRLERVFSGAATRRLVSSVLVATFAISLIVIELGRRGVFSGRFQAALPSSHFHAVALAVNLLLSFEVASLVFAIVQSVSNAAGRQFEIFSLILLRRSFEAFAGLDEPVRWDQGREATMLMLADAGGAILIFVALGFYYAVQKHRPLSGDQGDRSSFVVAKKLIALLMLAVLAGLAGHGLWDLVVHLEAHPFFETFYSLLIFADVLVVLISLRYSASYPVVFRNSGLAVTTVLLRLALTAPPPMSGLLGVVAVLYALGLTLAYNRFAPATRGAGAA